MKIESAPYSYRADSFVPAFDDAAPLIVFDGVCVLCSGFVKFVLRYDRAKRFRFTLAQGPLGQALYRHYRLDPVEFETNLVIRQGVVYSKLGAFAVVLSEIGGIWKLFCFVRFIPQPFSDWLYDRIAKNRYRMFGRTEYCMVPDAGIRDRFIGPMS